MTIVAFDRAASPLAVAVDAALPAACCQVHRLPRLLADIGRQRREQLAAVASIDPAHAVAAEVVTA